MTRVADTSFLYAFFERDDAHHPKALEAMEDLETIEVPAPILVETIDLIRYRRSHAEGAAALRYLLDLPHVVVSDPVPLEGVWDAFRRGEGRLSLADAFVVQTCRTLGAQPLAYDRGIRDALA